MSLSARFISKFGIEIGSVTIVFLRGRTAAAVGPPIWKTGQGQRVAHAGSAPVADRSLSALPAALAFRAGCWQMPQIIPTAKRSARPGSGFLFKIYDAELFAPDGSLTARVPALRLNYLLDEKDRIISSTVKEMTAKGGKQQGGQGWVPLMEDAFISMDKGSYADFIHTGDGELLLTANGKLISEITDSKFILLMDVKQDQVRDKGFRDKLMGRVK